MNSSCPAGTGGFRGAILAAISKINNQRLVFVAAIVTGCISGFAAVALKTVVFYCRVIAEYVSGVLAFHAILFLLPLTGIVVTVLLISYGLQGKLERGSGHVLHAISRHGAQIKPVHTYAHILTSGITVGLGGSAGLESPIVVTGAAIGSNTARLAGLSYRDRALLLACGSAAGIAAVFNAPVAGVMFALEILLVDVTLSSFVPLIIASAAGALIAKIMLQENILFTFTQLQPFNYFNIPYYIGLGIVTGAASVLYIRVFSAIEQSFRRRNLGPFTKAVLGGILLGCLLLVFPPLFGEGYEAIKLLAANKAQQLFSGSFLASVTGNAHLAVFLVLVTGLLKSVATSLTLSSGGNGGNFAPSLFTGAFLGFAYASAINLLGGNAPVGNITIIAMAGVLCGVMHAPLGAAFLIAEITGGYALIIPLMVVVSISFLMVRHFEPYSLDKRDLAKHGLALTENKDRNILSLLNAAELIETGIPVVPMHTTLKELAGIISRSTLFTYPVVNASGMLIGIIQLEKIRQMLFELEQYSEIPVVDIMDTAALRVAVGESAESIMAKFEASTATHLPVTEQNGRFIGVVAKSRLLDHYRGYIRENFSRE